MVKKVRDQITSNRRLQRESSNCVLCIPYILTGSPNRCWLHTCNACIITTWKLVLFPTKTFQVEIKNETVRRFARLHPSRMELANSLSGKERGLKTSKNCHGSMPPDPLILEACAFGDRLGNRSVFILDPRLGIFHKALKHVAIW